MKRYLTALCAFLIALPLLLPLAGCSSAKKGEVLRVYNWEDYISTPKSSDGEDDESIPDLIAAFEKEYGVTVEYSTFGTNENMYNELKINAAGYDLVCPSDYMIMKMINENMVEPFSEEFLNNGTYSTFASPYIKNLFDKNGWTQYAAAYMWGTMGFVYNPELVDANDLSSWAGIWDIKYHKKSTIKDSVRDSYFLGVAYVYRDELTDLAARYAAGTVNAEEYSAALEEIMNRTDEDTRNRVKDALLSLKPNLYGFEVDSGKQDMITGKISINFAWSGDAVYSMDEAEDPDGGDPVYLNYAIPEECTNIWFDGWVMPKGSNTKLAEKFIDFLSRPENAAANMNFIGYTSAVGGDAVFDEMIDWYDESADPENRGFDEDGNALEKYDLNYFFRGTGEYDDYSLYVSEDSMNRQIYAQYPTEDVIARCAIMKNFTNEETAAVNEMWEEVKGLPIPVWAYIAIAVIAAGIVAIALSYVYKGKRSEPKPKKGYRRVSSKEKP